MQQYEASKKHIAEKSLSLVYYKEDTNVPDKIIDVDTLVASLIVTIAFVAIFTIPGRSHDKDSKIESKTARIASTPSGDKSGVARMDLDTLFQVFFVLR